MTAHPDLSGVSHPATWPFSPHPLRWLHRWLGGFVGRRRPAVTEHGTEHVPADGPVILAASRLGVTDGRLLDLSGRRLVHVQPAGIRTCMRLLADGHAVGLVPVAGDLGGFHRAAAYLALVSGAPVVPVTVVGSAIVYGAPYRAAQTPWPRTRRLVEVTSLDLSVHLLVALDAAHTLTSVTPNHGGTP